MLADIAQISLQHEERRQYQRDIAGLRHALLPQDDGEADNGGAQQDQHRALDAAVERAALPGADGARAPLADHMAQPFFFARPRRRTL